MSNVSNQFANYATYPPYSQLQSKMDDNYKIAISYYKQKERLFESVLKANAIESLAAYEKMIKQKANKFNEIALQANEVIAKNFMSGLLDEQKAIAKAKVSKTGKYSYEMAMSDLISQGYAYRTRGGQVVAGSRLGFPFERWLADGVLTKEAENESYKQGKKLNAQLTAKIKNIASTTARAGDIRSDIAISADGKEIIEGTQFEMTAILNLEDLKASVDQDVGQILLDEILSSGQYGNIDIKNLFGFQVKSYQNSDSTRWQQSVPLAKSLNEIYGFPNNTKSWSSNYAAMYPYYFLSKFILNIVNPVNIGIITLNGLEYTSNFLQHYRFYMEVAWSWTRKYDEAESYRGGGLEIMDPHVVGTTVMLRQVKQGLTLQVSAKNIKSKQRDISRKVAEVVYR